MPVVLPIIGAATSLAGAAIGAGAKQGIADAQQQQAASDRAAAMSYAAPTAQEIQSIGDRINQQQRYQSVQQAGLDRDTSILNTLDPSLVQAGQQAQKLMSGQAASILAPMQQQQTYERNQLQQKLAAQLGPGWQTSSAGQSALQSFDMQSNLQTQQAQMTAFNSVSQYLNYGIQSSNAINSQDRLGFETGSQMSAQTLQSMNTIQARQTNAILATSPALQNSAGGQYAGSAATGASLTGLGSSTSTLGGQLMGQAMNPAPQYNANTGAPLYNTQTGVQNPQAQQPKSP